MTFEFHQRHSFYFPFLTCLLYYDNKIMSLNTKYQRSAYLLSQEKDSAESEKYSNPTKSLYD
jgi:hypothetical protein